MMCVQLLFATRQYRGRNFFCSNTAVRIVGGGHAMLRAGGQEGIASTSFDFDRGCQQLQPPPLPPPLQPPLQTATAMLQFNMAIRVGGITRDENSEQ